MERKERGKMEYKGEKVKKKGQRGRRTKPQSICLRIMERKKKENGRTERRINTNGLSLNHERIMNID